MENWRRVWRDGFAPLISTKALGALKLALETNDPRLIQGATTSPPPLQCVLEWPVECGCLIGYCGAVDLGGFLYSAEDIRLRQADSVENEGYVRPHPNVTAATVAEVEEYFARMCFEVDQKIGESAGCRYLLNYFDEDERDKVFAEMLAEVNRELADRQTAATTT
jgi:hypothetical protein